MNFFKKKCLSFWGMCDFWPFIGSVVFLLIPMDPFQQDRRVLIGILIKVLSVLLLVVQVRLWRFRSKNSFLVFNASGILGILLLNLMFLFPPIYTSITRFTEGIGYFWLLLSGVSYGLCGIQVFLWVYKLITFLIVQMRTDLDRLNIILKRFLWGILFAFALLYLMLNISVGVVSTHSDEKNIQIIRPKYLFRNICFDGIFPMGFFFRQPYFKVVDIAKLHDFQSHLNDSFSKIQIIQINQYFFLGLEKLFLQKNVEYVMAIEHAGRVYQKKLLDKKYDGIRYEGHYYKPYYGGAYSHVRIVNFFSIPNQLGLLAYINQNWTILLINLPIGNEPVRPIHEGEAKFDEVLKQIVETKAYEPIIQDLKSQGSYMSERLYNRFMDIKGRKAVL